MTPQIRAIAVLSLVSSLVPYTVIAQGNSSSILSNVAAVGNSSSVLSTGVAVGNYSDDVISVDTAWANYFPPYEGTSDPVLNDYYDNSTIGLDLTNETAFWSQPEMSLMAAKDFYLRIMPLGASITEGVRSSDGNGYRKYLRDQLRWKGWRVNMVGSKQNGNMADKDNEGHPGWIITEIHQAYQNVQAMQPNVVLINAGTNDCGGNIDTGNAGARLKVMVDDIVKTAPGALVVVSTLVPSRDHQSCALSVSQQFRDMVKNYNNDKVVIADMISFLTASDLTDDGIHPTDAGYKKMAAVWWDAISKAEDKLTPPGTATGIDDSKVSSGRTCTKVAGNARGPIQSQKGSGHDDGNYVHKSTNMGNIASGKVLKGPSKNVNNGIPTHMFFAQLVYREAKSRSEALDDWVRIEHQDDNTNIYWFRENMGGGTFTASKKFDVDMDCNMGPQYAWADFNNDGLDDFFCLLPGSAVGVSINQGGNPPTFKYLGQVVPTHDGYDAPDVRIADIDGDGRADYCLIGKEKGDILCSRNQGVGNTYYWQGFQTMGGLRELVFPAKNKGDKNGVRLLDLNGDFRSDWMWLSDTGSVDTYINQRGWGAGIVPDWASAGITHPGLGIAGSRDNIKFGRIYGSGRLDYVYFTNVTDGYEMHVYRNDGAGGTRRKADGNFYCDMTNSGSDDYVWIYYDGHTDSTDFFMNVHNPPYWGNSGRITLSVPGPRMGVHLADWDGDGKCDVLVQNKETGALTMYENRYDASTKKLTFANVGVVTGAATCNQGWGVNIFDRGMRLADIDGDKRADVICLEPNGRSTAWLNTKSGMQNIGQIKKTEGWDRAMIRFADVEGSGRADLIHLNRYTGAGEVLKNNGLLQNSGSAVSWTARGVLYSPIDRADNMHFTNQGGLGRADLLNVLPVSNTAYTYFNECGGGSGGDDGLINDPNLPAYGGSDGGGDGGDYPIDGSDQCTKYCDLPEPTACGTPPASLNDLGSEKDLGRVQDHCVNLFLMHVLYDECQAALDKYQKLMNDGFDDDFNRYRDYVLESIQPQILEFMRKHAGEYFDCKKLDERPCCSKCTSAQGCQNGCVPDSQCEDGGSWVAATCPTEYHADPGTAISGVDSTKYKFSVKNRDDFNKKMTDDYGVPGEWIKFDAWPYFLNNGCQYVPGSNCALYYDGFPMRADNVEVPNPKDGIEPALDQYKSIRDQLGQAYEQSNQYHVSAWRDDTIVEASELPVYMLVQGVDSMQSVHDTAKEITEAEKKEMILLFITGILGFIPVAGEGLASLGLATLGRIIRIVGGVGDAAFDLYGIVESPESAIFSVFGGLINLKSFGQASGPARNMIHAGQQEKLGPTVKSKTDQVNKIKVGCK